jgi:hypothetical protein
MKKIKLAYLLLVLVSACKENTKEEATAEVISKQPNIIFIMSDDHAYQAISAYDHPVSKLAPTPNVSYRRAWHAYGSCLCYKFYMRSQPCSNPYRKTQSHKWVSSKWRSF